jgi:trehalose 6-phosphate synthase
MNLVAKEYVAAQDPGDPGVLGLSRFAGAAEEMEEALQVNPYDTDNVAKALHMALAMTQEERRERHAALFKRISEKDAAWWLNAFLDRLSSTSGDHRTADERLAAGL